MTHRMPRGSTRALLVSLAAAAAFAGVPTGTAHASSVAVPSAIFTNGVGVTEPNGVTHDQSSNTATNGLLINGSNLGYNPPDYWIAATSNDYRFPSLHAEASIDNGLSAAGSNLIYYVAFTGADGVIPVNVRGYGFASYAAYMAAPEGSPHTYTDNRAAAFLDIKEVSGPEIVNAYAESNLVGNTGAYLFSLDQQYMLKANTVYEVVMYASVNASYGRKGIAEVDPFFSPPDGYTVLTSDGVGNSFANAPIPASLPLFASGLGGLGLAAWRRRSAAAAT